MSPCSRPVAFFRVIEAAENIASEANIAVTGNIVVIGNIAEIIESNILNLEWTSGFTRPSGNRARSFTGRTERYGPGRTWPDGAL